MLTSCSSSAPTQHLIPSNFPPKPLSSRPITLTTPSNSHFPPKAAHHTIKSKSAHFSPSTQRPSSSPLNLFLQTISSSSHPPDILALRSVLKDCIRTKNCPLALQVHSYIVKLDGSCTADLITNTCLINLYGEFGLTQLARDVFDRIPLRDVVAFTSVMLCYNKAGEYDEASRMFMGMIETDGLLPNAFAFTCVLSALAGLSSIFEGQQIHARVIKASLQSDVFVGTALVKMYNSCGRVDCARKAFFGISQPNVVSWNAVMGGKVGCKEVMEFFLMLQDAGASPDLVTFATVLRACKDVSLFSIRQIHGMVLKMFGADVDVFIGTSLFERYVDDGCNSDAKKVFECIHGKDITAFNLAIHGYKRNGHEAEAFSLFYEAIQVGMEPNEATLTSLLVGIQGLSHGKQLHALVTKLGFSGTTSSRNVSSIASSLVVMYSQFHCLDDAKLLFDKVHSPDLVLWTSMISSFCQNGEHQEALKCYNLMLLKGLTEAPNHYTFSSVLCSCASLSAAEEGKQIHAQILKSDPSISSDVFVSSGLVDMYSKCGYITEAKCFFDKMPERDLAAWNAMITGLAQHGYAQTAIKVFQGLLNLTHVKPNDITFLGVLSACSHSGLVAEGCRYFKLIKEPTISHYACLIDLLGRAGHIQEALNLIEEMPYEPNEITWSSLLAASVAHCKVEVGEYLATRLVQLNPKDPGTYIALSNIYAAAGRWEDVNKVRKLMDGQGVRKDPGLSWLQVKGRTHVFLAAGCGNAKTAPKGMQNPAGEQYRF